MDLHSPLGSRPRLPRPRRARLWVLAGAVVATCLGAWFLVATDPRGGEPYAVALIPPAPVSKPAPAPSAAADPMPTGSIASPGPDNVRIENGVKVVSPADAGRPSARETAPLVIDVSKALDSAARKSRSGDKGTHAAGPTAPGAAGRPRIAIFVGGLGLSEGPTLVAADTMPTAVALAFVPYGASISTTIASARSKGHEILLQLPMQSAQGTTSGPHTLRTTGTGAEFAADLAWLTSRFDGYVGVTNLLGAPVTSNATTMTAVLKGTASHGAFYLDDGTSRRSLAVSIGRSLGVPTLQADVVLDATSDPSVVAANLEKLVAIARTKGSAIGMASGLSDHLGIVSRFANQLDGRGLSLVPISMIARERTNLAESTTAKNR